jgi:autotransporter-associated beta strand protein
MPYLAALALLAPLTSLAQVVWTGAGANQLYTTPGNWQSGIVPPNTGADSATFTGPVDAGSYIAVNTAANLSGITLNATSGYTYYEFNQNSGGTLTLGSGGIATSGAGNSGTYLQLPVVLSASQTWGNPGTSGYIEEYGGYGISGPGTLTTNSYVYLGDNNTFTGGVTVASGQLELGSSMAAGTGTLTIDSGAGLYFYGTNPDAVSLGASPTLGSDEYYGSGTLSGPITLTASTTNLDLNAYSSVTTSGAVTGPASSTLEISGNGAQLPYDGGSQLVFQGTLAGVTGLNLVNVALILDPAGPAMTAFGTLAPSAILVNNAYLGLDGTFASTPGAVSTFLGYFGAAQGSAIDGTIGFDSIEGGTNTFSDPINLANYTSPDFLGLGSSTSAIVSGAITPVDNSGSYYYPFGGGGGTLTVTSNLVDGGGPTGLTMTDAPSPLTLILQGGTTYTGGTHSYGGVLIFDSAVLPATGLISLDGGYVGYTETPGITATQFIALFNTSGYGVLGFDQAVPNPSSPRMVLDAINMSNFNSGSNVFIGTSTTVTLTGMITPANYQYLFTGVKGGSLTVASTLADVGGATSAVIGVPNAAEANGSESTVTLSGTNSYTGGTTFNTGTLYINNGSALGTGAIMVPDTSSYNNEVPNLAPYGGTVTLLNPISVGSSPGLQVGNYYTSDMLVLNGVISDYLSSSGQISVVGQVTFNGTNTYSGGTTLEYSAGGDTVALVGNNSALGIGPITDQYHPVQSASTYTIAATGGPVLLSNPIALNWTLTLGQAGNPNLLTLNGNITSYYNFGLDINGPVELNGDNTFTGNVVITDANVIIGNANALGSGSVSLTGSTISYSSNPTILDLAGDAGSSIGLASGQTLTLDTDTYAEPAAYEGSITGDATNSVVVQGTGVEYLGGSSTYAGGTTVVSGRLIAGTSTALGTGPVTVDSGAGLGTDSSANLTIPITLNPGAEIGGIGTFSPASGLTISGGTKVSPGSNGVIAPYVGTVSFGTPLTFGAGGIYVFDVQNAGGVAGTDYDTVNASGGLAITATPGSPFQVSLRSVDGTGALGLANFNATLPYSWTLVSASSISGFSAANFSIYLGNFQNSLGMGGTFVVGQSGNNLTLNFTPVPEPSTWILMAAGLATVGFRFRRTRRA